MGRWLDKLLFLFFEPQNIYFTIIKSQFLRQTAKKNVLFKITDFLSALKPSNLNTDFKVIQR